jgi:pentatricopeptide repeat protein
MLPKKSIHILFDESNNELSIKTNEKQAASVNLKQNTIIRNNKTELDKEEVVRINNEIANHANRKELKEAKAKFDYLKNNQAINSHSYAIMINAYVRCGDIISSTALFDEILRRKWRIDIITFTTVMKGYCNECSLIKALELFSIMLTMNPPVQPNIRTINTFLRGCIITGNVMLAEEYFNKAKKEYHLQLDCSSYEYMIKLYCQALDIDKVSPMIGRLKENHTIISSLHFIYYDISRAYALLGDWKLLQRYLKLIDENITNDTSAVQEYDNQGIVV